MYVVWKLLGVIYMLSLRKHQINFLHHHCKNYVCLGPELSFFHKLCMNICSGFLHLQAELYVNALSKGCLLKFLAPDSFLAVAKSTC